jgi:hypothetical protein
MDVFRPVTAGTLIALGLRSGVVSAPRPRIGRRWLVAGLVGVTVLVVAAVFVRFVVLRDNAHAVPANEALKVFRAQSTTSTQPASTTATTAVATSIAAATSTTVAPLAAPPLVEPGIYRYKTTGSEQIDALGGTSHDYPPETTLTVVPGDCGVRVRWDALRERRDEWALCSSPDGIDLGPLGVQYHEFYNQPDEEAVSCDRKVLIVPILGSASEGPQQLSCTLADDPWMPTWEVLERTTRSVEGATIDVQHVRMTVDDNDEYFEHTVVDWYLTATGLPVEMSSTKESRTPSPIGGIVYHEQYDLTLISTTPLR